MMRSNTALGKPKIDGSVSFLESSVGFQGWFGGRMEFGI